MEEYLDYNDLKLPLTTSIAERNPVDYPLGSMWRDTVRRQLHFSLLQVDFRTIVLDDDSGMCIFSTPQPEQAAPWTDVLQHISNLSTASLTYILDMATRSDDEDFTYKYDGPPLAIADDVAISADHDVELIGVPVDNNGDPDDISIPPQLAVQNITSIITPFQDISNALSKFQEGVGNAKVASRPEDFF